METKRIKPERRTGGWRRGCTTEIVYSGSFRHGEGGDVGAIDRIERSYSLPGFVAPMHPHRDEEIMTCIRSGTLLHLDSMGHEEKLGAGSIMVMNAGTTIHHEERTLGRDPVEGYHLHFHPEREGLATRVQFMEASAFRVDEWRLLASPSGAPLILRSQAKVLEGSFSVGSHRFPDKLADTRRILIVFEGKVRIGSELFRKGDILLPGDALETFAVLGRTDLLLVDAATPTEASAFSVPLSGTPRSNSGG